MRLSGWLLCGAFLLGCDPPRAATGARATAADPPIHVFQSDSQGEEIRDIAVGSRVWAVNRGAPGLARYSADGRLEWHGLEQGQGPDQARTAWSVVADGDTAFVWDPLTRRLLRVVDRQVTPVATFDFATTRYISGPAHGINFGHPGRLRRYRGGWITYATDRDQSHAFDLTQIVLLRFDSAGRVVDTLADLRSAPVITDQAAYRASGPKELVPVPMWDVCGGDRLVFYDPKGPWLSWERPGGTGRDSLRFDFTPGPIPEGFARAYYYWQLHVAAQGRISEDTLRYWLEATFPQEKWIFGHVEPFAAKLFCDAGERVWLERFSADAPPRGLSQDWLVIDLATKSTRAARFPPGFRPLAADSIDVFGAVEDSGGVSQVATVAIGSVLH